VLAICASFRASSLIGSRDTGTAIGKGGSRKVVESNGNLKKKLIPIMLASVKKQCWPKNDKRNYRKFISIWSWYSMKLSMILLWKRHLRHVTPLSKVRGAMPSISGVPACRYQQSLSRCITCQDVCVQMSHHMQQNTDYLNLKWILEDLLPCYCYTIKTSFFKKMLGTRYGPVGTRFRWFQGPDFLWF